jgi:type I restriction enzyme S subunit
MEVNRSATDHAPLATFVEVNPRRKLGAALDSSADVSFIPMSDVSETGEWIPRQVRLLKDVSSGFTAFLDGDVLFAKITPCMENGKGCHAIGLCNSTGFGSTEFHVLRAGPEMDSRFLFHVCQSTRLRLKAEAFMIGSAGQRRVPSEFFRHYSVVALPLAEQRRIAEILDTLDEAIRKTEQVIAKLQQMKQGLLHDLLTRGIDENGELRDPERHPEQFKDSPLGRIPRGWEVGPLGCFLAGIDAGWSPSCPEEPPTQGQWGVLKVSAVSSGRYYPSESKRLPDGLQPVPSLEVQPGDVLCVRANGVAELVGRSVYVESTPSRLMLSDKTLRLLPAEKLLARYLHFLFSGAVLRRQMGQLLNGTSGQRNISQAQIRSLVVAVPPVTEQRFADDAVASHEVRLKLEQAQLGKLRALKQGLMDALLTGRVRVVIPDEATA